MEEPGPGSRARWWAYRGLGLPRSLGEVRYRDVAVLVVVGLTVWFHVDVGRRGRVVAGRPELHQTDVTVFTEAGAAFFDGRDPYAVKNPRGWSYLYPPLFALMLAPASALDPVAQVLVWYVVSVALGFGCVAEARRLWRLLAPGVAGRPPDAALPAWVAACAGLTVALPTLECLQRGQLGIALLYALLLGYRLVIGSAGGRGRFAGGVVLAWAASVKLLPALPVGFLLCQTWALALSPRRARGDAGRAAAVGAGVLAGAFLFLLAVPAATLGWEANRRHLASWSRKVLTNDDPGRESKFHIDSATNQSLPNAAHSLAGRLSGGGPGDLRSLALRFATNEGERRWAEDWAAAHRRRSDRATALAVKAAQALILALLLGLAVAPPRDDPAGRALGFGLASLATLLVSPVAWTHYYMMYCPAVIAAPLWLARWGRPRAARAAAAVPAALVWAHYLAKRSVGPVGLLGLGTAAWFLAACAALVAARLAAGPPRRRAGACRGGWSGWPPWRRRSSATSRATRSVTSTSTTGPAARPAAPPACRPPRPRSSASATARSRAGCCRAGSPSGPAAAR